MLTPQRIWMTPERVWVTLGGYGGPPEGFRQPPGGLFIINEKRLKFNLEIRKKPLDPEVIGLLYIFKTRDPNSGIHLLVIKGLN
jgi:hypothetical protein